MHAYDSRDHESPARRDDATPTNYTCPRCGRAIDGIEARAPSEQALSCGCDATLTTREAVEGAETRLMTDGGRDANADIWYSLTAFQRDILRVLARLDREDTTSYGLAIKRELEARYGEEVNHGRLYPNLDDLVDEYLIAKSELDRRTNEYVLTDRGQALLHAQWLNYGEDIDRHEVPDDRVTVPEPEASADD